MALALLTAGCEREQREYRPKPALAALTRTISMSDIRPGGGPPPPTVHNAYEQNAFAVSEGKQLFRQFNCNGCHANGGGGMGPPLMDQDWIYGSAPANGPQTRATSMSPSATARTISAAGLSLR